MSFHFAPKMYLLNLRFWHTSNVYLFYYAFLGKPGQCMCLTGWTAQALHRVWYISVSVVNHTMPNCLFLRWATRFICHLSAADSTKGTFPLLLQSLFFATVFACFLKKIKTEMIENKCRAYVWVIKQVSLHILMVLEILLTGSDFATTCQLAAVIRVLVDWLW